MTASALLLLPGGDRETRGERMDRGRLAIPSRYILSLPEDPAEMPGARVRHLIVNHQR
jgi:hypothetical protein